MKISVEDIKKSYSNEKKNSDRSEWFAYFLIRPISFYIALFFINMRISANSVTILSLFISLLGSGLIGFGDFKIRLAGCACLLIWLILDHVDGNIARYNNTQSLCGEFLDSLAGYFTIAFFPIFLGLAAYFDDQSGNEWVFLLLGGIASITNILPRLVYQKFRLYSDSKDGYREIISDSAKMRDVKLVRRFVFNLANNLLDPSGFLFVIVFAVVYFGIIDMFLVVYALLGVLITAISTFKFSKRMYELSNNVIVNS